MSDWHPIETAPRNRNILVAWRRDDEWRVQEAWWRMPYEAAASEQCAWQTMTGMLLSADVHRAHDGTPLGATHWMPLPEPPQETKP